MTGEREYGFADIMSLTTEDLRTFNNNEKMKGWDALSEEEQRQCLAKLMDLSRELEDEQSKPIDALKLDDRLRQLVSDFDEETSRKTRRATTPLDDDVEEIILYQRKFYDNLIHEGGIPVCLPEQYHELLINPGDLKGLFQYWESQDTSGSILEAQLVEWKNFREFQDIVRKQHDWLEYQRKVQANFQQDGLHDILTLDKNLASQNRLATWLEYQAYHSRVHIQSQVSVDEAQAKLAGLLKKLGCGILEYKEDGLQDELISAAASYMVDEDEILELETSEESALEKLNSACDKLREISGCQMDPKIGTTQGIGLKRKSINANANRQLEIAIELLESTIKNSTINSTMLDQIRTDIQAASRELDEINPKRKLLDLRLEVSTARNDLQKFTSILEQHNFMLEWIEQQRQSIVAETEKISPVSQIKQKKIQDKKQGNLSQRKLKRKFEDESIQSDVVKENQNEAELQSPSVASPRRILRSRTPAKNNPVEDARPAKKQRRESKAGLKKMVLQKQTQSNLKRPSKEDNRRKVLTKPVNNKAKKDKSTLARASPKQRAGRKAANTTKQFSGQLRRSARIAARKPVKY